MLEKASGMANSDARTPSARQPGTYEMVWNDVLQQSRLGDGSLRGHTTINVLPGATVFLIRDLYKIAPAKLNHARKNASIPDRKIHINT